MSTIRRSLDGDKAVEMDVIEAKADADTAPATPIPPAVAHEHRLQRTSRVPSPRPLGILPRLLADARPSTASSTTRSPPPTLSLPAAPSQTALSLAATSLHPSRTSLAHPSADADADHPPPASFHTLPPELHLAIARRLDFPTALRWRLACRYFCALLPADALPRKRRAYVVALHRHAARMAQNPPAEPPSRRSRLLAKRRHRNVPAAATGVQLPCHQCLRLKSVPDFESHTWGLDPGLPPVLPPAAATVTAIVDPWAAAAGLVDGSDSTTSASSTSSSGGGGGGGGGGYDDDWAAEEGRVPYRVCVQCKLRKGLFARGARFDWRGRERVLCRRCRRPGARMARHGVRWALMREMCRGCGTRAEWRWMAPVAVGEALLAGLVSALVAWGARCAAEAGGSLELGSPFRCIVFTGWVQLACIALKWITRSLPGRDHERLEIASSIADALLLIPWLVSIGMIHLVPPTDSTYVLGALCNAAATAAWLLMGLRAFWWARAPAILWKIENWWSRHRTRARRRRFGAFLI